MTTTTGQAEPVRLPATTASSRRAAVLATVLMVVSLTLPCIDTRFEDQLGGIDVRGYQCFVGVFLASFVAPASTPVWITIAAANLLLLLLPFSIAWPSWRRVNQYSLSAGACAAIYLALLGQHSGVSQMHGGAWVWLASLVLGAIVCSRIRTSPSST